MHAQPLAGRKIAVLVEHKFIPEEIEAYRTLFPELGAKVEFVSRLRYGTYRPDSVTFYSDVDPLDNAPTDLPVPLDVARDVEELATRLDDYSAVIMSANYTSVRLRFSGLPKDSLADLTPADIASFDPRAHTQHPPVVRLFAEAMQKRRLVKGALCHGLWVLTPNPHLLRGRKVICHSVVMADILNCDATIVLNNSGVVTDDDLVTGFSKHEVRPFIQAVAAQIASLCVPA
jgi:protease I